MQILLWFVVCICTEVKPTFNKEVKYYFHLTQIHRSTGFSFDVREVQMKNFWWSDFFFKHRSRSQCNFIKNININKPMTIKKFILYSEALTRWLAQDSSPGICCHYLKILNHHILELWKSSCKEDLCVCFFTPLFNLLCMLFLPSQKPMQSLLG